MTQLFADAYDISSVSNAYSCHLYPIRQVPSYHQDHLGYPPVYSVVLCQRAYVAKIPLSIIFVTALMAVA